MRLKVLPKEKMLVLCMEGLKLHGGALLSDRGEFLGIIG
jgi:hypothetical protein